MKNCVCCGAEFEPYRDHQRFCCRACSDEHYAEEKGRRSTLEGYGGATSRSR
jgi:hypothetical protein